METLSDEEGQRPEFMKTDEGGILFHGVQTALINYLEGMSYGSNNLKRTNIEELRMKGHVIAHFYPDFTVRDMREILDGIQLYVLSARRPAAPRMESFVVARIAEGLYQAGKAELSQQIVAETLSPTHPERIAVEEYCAQIRQASVAG